MSTHHVTVTVTRAEVRHTVRLAHRAAERADVISDAERIMHHVDERIANVDSGRRADMLVALPAALAPLVPFLMAGAPGAATTAVLAMPVIIKIIRKF